MHDNSTKEKIIDAMYALIAEKGYDQASVGQIAERVGIQKASIYYYFKSKEDILLQLTRELYLVDYFAQSDLFEQDLTAADYRTELVRWGDAIIDSYFEQPELRRVYAEIDLQTTRIPALKEIDRTVNASLLHFLTCVLQRGKELGALPEALSTEYNAQLFFVLLMGMDSSIMYDLPVDAKQVWREAVDKLFEREERV